MQALKVVAEGAVTSFRYPYFAQGVHPTFEMPPPATVYGQVCGAIGDLIDPALLRFGYHFRYTSKFTDYEHLHFFGKKPKMNPFQRELLFQPRLTLYLSARDPEQVNIADLVHDFRHPRYAASLGRSQDLMEYTDVRPIELVAQDQAFFTGTLLTLEQAAIIGGRSYAVTMPRYLTEMRVPEWGQYAMLPDDPNPVVYPDDEQIDLGTLNIWVDPEEDAAHPFIDKLQRGVIWHDWTA